MTDLVKRMKATQKTVDRFKGKPFTDGKFDCVQLVVRHARGLGVKIEVPPYGSVAGAAKALRQMGFDLLSEAADHFFERIEPSRVLLGDIIEMPGQNGFSSLSVAVGNGRVLGFHEDVPHCDILQPVMISGAWRIG